MRSKFQSEGYLGAGGHEDTIPPKPTFLWESGRGVEIQMLLLPIVGCHVDNGFAWCSNTDPLTPLSLPRAQLQALYMISTIYQHFRLGR